MHSPRGGSSNPSPFDNPGRPRLGSGAEPPPNVAHFNFRIDILEKWFVPPIVVPGLLIVVLLVYVAFRGTVVP